MMGKQVAVTRLHLDGFEGLQEAVKGSRFDVMQLGRGQLRGTISHIEIEDVVFSLGNFNRGIRAKRTPGDDNILVAMLLSASDRVTQWSWEMQPADVVVVPASSEHHAVHHGASAYAAIRLHPDDVTSLFFGRPWLSDPDNWSHRQRYRPDALLGGYAARQLSLMARTLATEGPMLSVGAAQFWKRTIVDCMSAAIACSHSTDEDGHLPSALKLVGQIEDYLDATGDRPVHISEICRALQSSRRTLHRAFHDVFGIGPVTFLRQKRLCAAHTILKRSPPEATTVGDVAIGQGFIELGRFSRYYREMFGEYPSQTLGRGAAQRNRPSCRSLPVQPQPRA
jgi:methylphosphotriester-DNA--protein-cysteine methyltransferase